MKSKVKVAFLKGVILGLVLGVGAETLGIYINDLAFRVSRIETFLTAVTQGR